MSDVLLPICNVLLQFFVSIMYVQLLSIFGFLLLSIIDE